MEPEVSVGTEQYLREVLMPGINSSVLWVLVGGRVLKGRGCISAH